MTEVAQMRVELWAEVLDTEVVVSDEAQYGESRGLEGRHRGCDD